jgi:hypothetical protein
MRVFAVGERHVNISAREESLRVSLRGPASPMSVRGAAAVIRTPVLSLTVMDPRSLAVGCYFNIRNYVPNCHNL